MFSWVIYFALESIYSNCITFLFFVINKSNTFLSFKIWLMIKNIFPLLFNGKMILIQIDWIKYFYIFTSRKNNLIHFGLLTLTGQLKSEEIWGVNGGRHPSDNDRNRNRICNQYIWDSVASVDGTCSTNWAKSASMKMPFNADALLLIPEKAPKRQKMPSTRHQLVSHCPLMVKRTALKTFLSNWVKLSTMVSIFNGIVR